MPGLIEVQIGPEEGVYFFQVVEDALPAHGPLLDFADGGVELVLHVCQVLGDAGVIVVVAREVEVAGGCFEFWAEGEGEGVEVLGLFGGLLVAVSVFDFVFAVGVEGAGCLLLLALVLDLPKLLDRQLLVVAARLDHFWHQQ